MSQSAIYKHLKAALNACETEGQRDTVQASITALCPLEADADKDSPVSLSDDDRAVLSDG